MIKEIAKSLGDLYSDKFSKCIIIKAKYKRHSIIVPDRFICKIESETSKGFILKVIGYKDKDIQCSLTLSLMKNFNKTLNLRSMKLKCDSLKPLIGTPYTYKDINNFRLYTGDNNPIHNGEKAIVQGMLILATIEEYLSNKSLESILIKFINPIYVNDDVYISEDYRCITGFSRGNLCFKVDY